jgi:hypothetical protein
MLETPNAPTDRESGEGFDLVDLWILFRTRALVFWGTLTLALAVGIGLALSSSTPQFRYTALIRVGSQRIGERFVQAMPTSLVQSWILHSVAPLSAIQLRRTLPGVQAIAAHLKVSPIVRGSGVLLQVNGTQRQSKTIQALFEAIGQHVEQGTNAHLVAQEKKSNRILKAEIQNLKKEIRVFQAQQEQIEHGTATLRSRAQFEEIEFLAFETSHLESQENHLERLLARPTDRLTELLGPVSRSPGPIIGGLTPIKKVGIFLLLGTVLGAALVILLHLREQARKRLRAQADP